MRAFTEEMDRLFHEGGRGRWPLVAGLLHDEDLTWTPAIEMQERDGRLFVRAELPGLAKANIKVQVSDQALTIEGERKQVKEASAEGYFRTERSYGRFARTIVLPDNAKPETAKATFKDGVLEIGLDVPAAVTPATRQLTIEERGGTPK
jgi:HSP20 family protein